MPAGARPASEVWQRVRVEDEATQDEIKRSGPSVTAFAARHEAIAMHYDYSARSSDDDPRSSTLDGRFKRKPGAASLNRNAMVYVLDDDVAFVESLNYLLASVGLPMSAFMDGASFVDAYEPDRPSCLILDLRLFGENGLDILRWLRSQGILLPIVMVSAYADVATAVEAIKCGACDFLEKPFRPQQMLEVIGDALGSFDQWRELHFFRLRSATLTSREEAVFGLIVAGRPNKGIAADLGISPKTVEVHRARVMVKMQADCVATLVRMQMILRLGPAHRAD
jgi:two-component system response regulator FixJ